MPKSLHIRDVPSRVHATLARRAARKGVSLRQYTIEVLSDHCARPTVEEWLEGLKGLPSYSGGVGASEALHRSRADDDEHVAGARRRR